ncbi:MAG: polysaccharide deacetylase family protein [Thermacetogeniaceae bacterium]
MFIFFKKKQFLYLSVFIILISIFCFIDNCFFCHAFQPIYQGSSARKWVAFTVNVDWGEEYLDELLKLFAKNKVPATFFVTGRWADKNPSYLKKIADQGHEIGNHGYSHPHVNNLTLAENIEEINKASNIILRITGKRSRFFAPPYGEFNETVLKAAQRTNHKTILWSIDTVDWKKPDPSWIISLVLENIHNGAIILMHPTQEIIQALPAILKGLSEQGYQVVPLEKLIQE